MLAVTGLRSSIVQALIPLLPAGEDVERIPMETTLPWPSLKVPKAQRFVLAAGYLPGKSMLQYTGIEASEVMACNLVNPIRICEWVLETNPTARICLIGSDSGRKGSFDKLYAAAKAGLHHYVMTRQVTPQQQLVCVSPPIIRDSGMTERRPDYQLVLQTRPTCAAVDVARVIHRALYHFELGDAPLVSNTILSVNPTPLQETLL